MTTALFTHPDCLGHDTGFSHPESSRRLRELLRALNAPEFAGLERREAPRAERAQLSRVHQMKYVSEFLDAIPETDSIDFTLDTVMSPMTGDAALRAAGAVCAAVDAVMGGEVDNAFCAVRPPGHHADSERAMGFCFFNNVAVGAAHAREAHGLKRVAIFDFDVHHGNGTQDIFKREPDVFFASTHQWLIFPKTGARTERGVGNLFNVPLARGTRSEAFRRAVTDEVIPAIEAFGPEMLFLSAGFDAHVADPIGGLKLSNDDFAWISEVMADLAARCCDGRLVSVLEGGYNPSAVATAGAAHVAALMAAAPTELRKRTEIIAVDIPLLKPASGP